MIVSYLKNDKEVSTQKTVLFMITIDLKMLYDSIFGKFNLKDEKFELKTT